MLAKVHEAASAGKARVYIPSGGIAGLDGIKAMMGADAEVSITSSKPPAAWKDVDYVRKLDVTCFTLRLRGERTGGRT